MANRFLVPGGTGDYDSTTNWSTTSGGASGATKPTASDAIIIDAASANAPLTISTINSCQSITCTSYTGTLTINALFNVAGTTNLGNITLSSGMTVTGTGTLSKSANGTTGTITTNGVVLDCHLQIAGFGNTTTTIVGSATTNKNFISALNNVAQITTINTGTINVGGDFVINGPVAGTAVLTFVGSTTATITQIAGRNITLSMVINKTGILNLGNFYWGAVGRTLTYTAGVVNHTGTLFCTSGTFNTNGVTWDTITPVANGGTYTLSSLLTANSWVGVGGSITFAGTAGFTIGIFNLPATATQAAINLANGITYRITNNLTHFGTGSGINNMGHLRALTGTANLILSPGATCKLAFINILNINATGGKTLRVLGLIQGDINKGATVSGCTNCFTMFSKIPQYNTTF